MTVNQDDAISALLHRTRREILRTFRDCGEEKLTTIAIAEHLNKPAKQVAYHMAVLRSQGALARAAANTVPYLYSANSKFLDLFWVRNLLDSTETEDRGAAS